jgi:hypothetical protein
MFLAALVVGLVTAWSFGPRAGLAAAAVALGMFLIAAVVPGTGFVMYTLVAVAVAAIAFAGAGRPRHPAMARAITIARAAWRRRR